MDESQYRALLEEIRSDVAEAQRTISELSTLENYVLGKLEGLGDSSAKGGRRRGLGKTSKSESQPVESKAGGQGMQTVEFGPDGFPST